MDKCRIKVINVSRIKIASRDKRLIPYNPARHSIIGAQEWSDVTTTVSSDSDTIEKLVVIINSLIECLTNEQYEKFEKTLIANKVIDEL